MAGATSWNKDTTVAKLLEGTYEQEDDRGEVTDDGKEWFKKTD
jgi:hypothetical protein